MAFVNLYTLLFAREQVQYPITSRDTTECENTTIVYNSLNYSCEVVVGIFTYPMVSRAIRDFQRTLIDNFDKTTRDPAKCSPSKPILVHFVAGIPSGSSNYDQEENDNNDFILIPPAENMDNGKTYFYFGSIQTTYKKFNAKFAFKADHDTFIHFDNLYKDLEKFIKSGELVYYGRATETKTGFMAGMLYGLSRPLIYQIMKIKKFATELSEHEDNLTSQWVDQIRKSRDVVYVNNTKDFYDHPDAGLVWSKPYEPNTIAIHQLKSWNRWNSTVNYFFDGDKRDTILKKLNTVDRNLRL